MKFSKTFTTKLFSSKIWYQERSGIVALLVFFLVLLGAYVAYQANAERLNLSFSLAFLFEPASFELGESFWVEPSSRKPFWVSLAAGILNTLKVAIFSIVFATIIGVSIALLQASPQRYLQLIGRGYVQLVRGIPILFWLFFWITLILFTAPPVQSAWSFFDIVFVHNRGLTLPQGDLWIWPILIFGAGFYYTSTKPSVILRFSSKVLRIFRVALLAVFLLLMVFVPSWELPRLEGFNFEGYSLSPEFFALLLGLSILHGALIGEYIRGAILAVPKGQKEAAASLGLSQAQSNAFVIVPIARRIATPPVINEYINVIKDSSLGVVLGYADLLYVTSLDMNRSGRALEGILIIMVIYLTFSLALSFTSRLLESFKRWRIV